MAEKKRTETVLVKQIKQKVLDEYSKQYGFFALPGERELAERYGVSRPTLHKALLQLEEEGKIAMIEGKGSFFIGEKKFANVSHPKAIGFHNMMLERGLSPVARILIQNVETADDDLAELLHIPAGTHVFHMRSLCYFNNELYGMLDDYIDLALSPDIFRKDMTNTTIYEELEKQGYMVVTMRGKLEIRPANGYEAMNLGIKAGDPLAIFRNTGYNREGNPLSHSIVRSLAYDTSYEIYTERI